MLWLIRIVLVIVAFVGCSVRANAGFFVCNDSGEPVNIAVGWWDVDDKQWLSRGWYHADPRECVSTVLGVLNVRYFYYYAVSDDERGSWDGSKDPNAGYFCTTSKKFYIINDTTNCEGERFRRVDMDGADQYTITLTEADPDPRAAALACANRMREGSRAFIGCWIRQVSSIKQRAILDCYDRYGTSASFMICANRDRLSSDQYKVATCASKYNQTRRGTEFLTCLAEGELSPETARYFDCAVRNQGDYSSMTSCAVAGSLTREQQRVYGCVANHLDDYVSAGLCAAANNLSPEQNRIAGCVLNNRGSYAQMGVCAVGNNLTPEQQVFASCAIESGGQPYVFAACVGTQLTVNELEKCMTDGIGGDGCFGRNNTVVKFASNAWKDVTEGPGPSNDLLGRDGWVGRNLQNAANDLQYGPGHNNDLVGEDGWVCQNLFGGC